MPNCDWGRPCNCRECTEMFSKEICEVCNENKTYTTNSFYEYDRKGRGYYNFTSYCQICWNKKLANDMIREQEKKELYVKKVKLRNEHIEYLNQFNYYPTPIKQAVLKYRQQIKIMNSDNWIKKHLISSFRDTLKIEKTKNRWYCCKNRLKNIDFNKFN